MAITARRFNSPPAAGTASTHGTGLCNRRSCQLESDREGPAPAYRVEIIPLLDLRRHIGTRRCKEHSLWPSMKKRVMYEGQWNCMDPEKVDPAKLEIYCASLLSDGHQHPSNNDRLSFFSCAQPTVSFMTNAQLMQGQYFLGQLQNVHISLSFWEIAPCVLSCLLRKLSSRWPSPESRETFPSLPCTTGSMHVWPYPRHAACVPR